MSHGRHPAQPVAPRRAGEADAWEDLTGLYRPLIVGWLNRQGVPASDLDDVTQDILLSVVKQLPAFEHSGRRGAFRSWLRVIACRRTADYWRAADAGTRRPAAAPPWPPSSRSPTPRAT